MTKAHLMKNYLLKMAQKMSQSLYITEIYRLAIELFKIKNGLSPEIFTEIIARETESHYNLRQCNDFRIPSTRRVYHGSKSISFLGPIVWSILPD